MFEAVDAQEMRVEVCTIFTKFYCFTIITDISQPTEHRWSPPLYWTDISYLPFIPPSFRKFLLEEGFYLLSLWFGAKCYRVQNKNDAHYIFVAHVVQWLVCSTWKLDGSGSILDLDLFFFLFFSFFFFFFSSILGGAIFLSKLKYDRVISNVLQCSSRRTWWKCRLHVTLMI